MINLSVAANSSGVISSSFCFSVCFMAILYRQVMVSVLRSKGTMLYSRARLRLHGHACLRGRDVGISITAIVI